MDKSDQILLSVVSPVYRGANVIDELVERVIKSVEKITNNYEIILVEDDGPDDSWQKITQICSANIKVKGIKLSRNFGQHYAITAGLDHASGEWIIVMDCDLQDLPEEIPNLYQKALEGFEIVYARRTMRQDGFFKRASSKIFYTVFSYLTDTKQDHTIANFGIYHKNVVTAILSMKDHIRYFPTMSRWVGFNKSSINVAHGKNEEKSTYTVGKLLQLAFDNMIAFSDKPLRLAVKLGIFISVISFCVGIYYLWLYFSGRILVPGFASTLISIWFLSGIIISILGISGLYIGKIFEAVKQRPTYIITKKIN